MSEIRNRKSVFDDLSHYDPSDKNGFIEITEWSNGGGWDISINDNKLISLSYYELDAINYLIKRLEYEGV